MSKYIRYYISLNTNHQNPPQNKHLIYVNYVIYNMSLNTNHQDPQITDLNTLHLAYVNICHL